MHRELGTSFLIVTHDPRLAERCDRLVELVDGRIERDQKTDLGAEQSREGAALATSS
jgi:lipoprotein-releasing system ATP-binding protein